ncbi:MAG: hypothetical protein IJ629_00325 [Clostridia bacterium]|nr:hypothetical protein [Clostridia bacterium]
MDENENVNVNNIDKQEVDNSARDMRMGKLNEYMPKAQNLQLVGKYLKDRYYPELSLDDINERIDMLADKGYTLDQIVDFIDHGQLDLITMNIDDLEIKNETRGNEENEGPNLE